MKKWVPSFLGVILTLASCAYFETPPASRAIVVGMDYYPNANSLSWCVTDAQSIAESLGIESGEIKKILATRSPAVTKSRHDILDSLEAARVEAPNGSWDLFLFYYSGHGIDLTGDLVFSNYGDGVTNDTIPPEDLLQAIAQIPARVRLVILDSCYSGNFIEESPAISPYPADYSKGNELFSFPFSFKLFSYVASAYSIGSSGDIVVMSAAGSDELSWEDGILKHGIFTAALLESIAKGDLNQDGLVSLTEAYAYARGFISREWNQQYEVVAYMPRISGSPLDVTLFRAAKD